MIPSVDLILGTLERALAVTILPAAGNASAREEASLGVLFVRWLRDVADHAIDAERASHRDCRAALAEVAAILSVEKPGPAVGALLAESRQLLGSPPAESIADVRRETQHTKALLGRALRAARQDCQDCNGGDDRAARAVRRCLADLAGREIERERAFGRATGMDPDAGTIPALEEINRRPKP